MLWQIEKAGRQNHILGTIHIADPDVAQLPGHIEAAIQQSQQLVLEVKQDVRSRQRIEDRTRLSSSSLRALIGQDLYQQVVDVMKLRGAEGPSLQKMKPWAVGLMLNYPVSTEQPVLDVGLQLRFQNAGKEVNALETIDEQLDLFDRMPMPEQIEFLALSLRQLDHFDADLATMKRYYRAGDLEAIHRFARQQLRQLGSPSMTRLMHEIIQVRNQRMFDRLGPYLAGSNTLIAVGALHLPGEQGLLQLMKNAGYRVRPVARQSR
jgi:uncharacterized protein YbaP (TraB family)